MGSCNLPPVNDAITYNIKEVSEDGTTFIRASVIATPIKLKPEDFANVGRDNCKDETPIKNLISLKRRSLVRDMSRDDENAGQKSTKHPMEMRSRKRSKLKEYYDYQEYDDFGEDLKFLFEEQLPDLKSRPRRKPRKRRPPIAIKKEPKLHLQSLSHVSSSTSLRNNASDPTSLSQACFCTRPNLKTTAFSDLDHCNSKNLTSNTKSAGSSHSSQVNNKSENYPVTNLSGNGRGDSDDFKVRPEKRKISSTVSSDPIKRKRTVILLNDCEKLTKGSDFDRKQMSVFGKTLKISCDKDFGRKGPMRLNCAPEKSGPHISQLPTNPTVTKMTLRRRHSTPSLVGCINNVETGQKMERTISTPAGLLGREVPIKKEGKFPKLNSRESSVEWNDEAFSCDEISDSEQFVDSPESMDSGFSSESNCSALTPDVELISSLNLDPSKPSTSCYDPQSRTTRASSHDSGILLPSLENNVADNMPQDGELRLVLCQKSIQEAERLESEAKKKQEEEVLREKYQCRWMDCPNPYESRSGAALHSHLEKYHAENYCCRWRGCKFFDVKSRTLTFLQRHIGEHSGEKPFKCILDGCDASFSSLSSRKRHVEAHYSEVSYPKAKVGAENGFSRYLLNSRRVKNKRKTLANRHDCMDNRTMGFIKIALIQNEVAMAVDEDDDVMGEASLITFQPEIIGERTDRNGKHLVLVRWKPENMLPNEWIPKSELENGKTLKKAELPCSAKEALKRLFFFGRKPNSRKSTERTSILKTLF